MVCEELGGCHKAAETVKVLTKYLKDDSLACSPLLFMSPPGRGVVKSRIKHNLAIYGL
jgi:hypothetical protein